MSEYDMNYVSAPAERNRTYAFGFVVGIMMALAAPPAWGSTFPPPDDSSSAPADSCEPLARMAAWPSWLTPGGGRRDNSIYPAQGHPAVARIIVPEEGATAYGSGTLVDVRDQYGLVITNWHVVRDSQGVVEVVFPSGFRSQARPLKVDSDWDLAALVIWRPPIEPVRIADHAPQPGDPLTIHGYGRGRYRIATGRCTTYYAPKRNFPHEMVELDVQARQGDSGGPMFNDRGEMAGVLFGAGQGTTIGAFAPRVETFLATLAPDIGQAKDSARIAVADRPAPNVQPLPHSAASPLAAPPAVGNDTVAQTTPAAQITPVGFPSANAKGAEYAQQSDGWSSSQVTDLQLAGVAPGQSINWRDVAGSDWFGFMKSALAIIGLVAVGLQVVRVVR
jgi:serine protease Do